MLFKLGNSGNTKRQPYQVPLQKRMFKPVLNAQGDEHILQAALRKVINSAIIELNDRSLRSTVPQDEKSLTLFDLMVSRGDRPIDAAIETIKANILKNVK